MRKVKRLGMEIKAYLSATSDEAQWELGEDEQGIKEKVKQ